VSITIIFYHHISFQLSQYSFHYSLLIFTFSHYSSFFKLITYSILLFITIQFTNTQQSTIHTLFSIHISSSHSSFSLHNHITLILPPFSFIQHFTRSINLSSITTTNKPRNTITTKTSFIHNSSFFIHFFHYTSFKQSIHSFFNSILENITDSILLT